MIPLLLVLGVAFKNMEFIRPNECEYNECLPDSSPYCSVHLPGVYNLQRGCPTGEYCSSCSAPLNKSMPILCTCEPPPFLRVVGYGEACDSSTTCSVGECYRSCDTYLHYSLCPANRCMWNLTTSLCVDFIEPSLPPIWELVAASFPVLDSEVTRAEMIVNSTGSDVFPMSFSDFTRASDGYRIQGTTLLVDFMPISTLFLFIDVNTDGLISISEFSALPAIFETLQYRRRLQESESLVESIHSKSIIAKKNSPKTSLPTLSPMTTPPGLSLMSAASSASGSLCFASGSKVYCPLDRLCHISCSDCGWMSALDSTNHKCVPPTPSNCLNDDSQAFCGIGTVGVCVRDCATCVNQTALDSGQGICIAPWWGQASSDPGICRFRRKVGQACLQDMDCIHGAKRCLNGVCAPVNGPCETDLDCHHLGFYCPDDPSKGADPFFQKICRPQKSDGQTCSSDSECDPFSRCNFVVGVQSEKGLGGAGQQNQKGICKKLFSLYDGELASVGELCVSGYADKNSMCSKSPVSYRLAKSCGLGVADCAGQCQCKSWWSTGSAAVCLPLPGDYSNFYKSMRDWLWIKAETCGSLWTDDECITLGPSLAADRYKAFMCEHQTLSGGPYLPSCTLSEQYIDWCSD